VDNDVHQHLAAAAFHLRPILGVHQTNLLVKAIKRYVSYVGRLARPLPGPRKEPIPPSKDGG
jgi:hypothetical protein